MVHSFTFPQEIITSIQERLEILEKCLNDANPQDEAMAEILELANSRQISLDRLADDIKLYRQKTDKLIRLSKKTEETVKQGEPQVLLFVRCNFLLKQILDEYSDFLLDKGGKKYLKIQTDGFVELYKQFKSENISTGDRKDEDYVIVETLKHVLQSIIRVSLRANALSQEDINALDLGDITPQESEVMLTFLASKKKWDWVYKNLA
ncbi:hypothetical protein NSTC745_04851 [Nostoc sp. DSM 114161]|jgi:hypothetical protein|uniref:hypothetical protein n=1 Tax=Nostoc sp. DSM 114161 TaxID=3440143 RepID=UPI004045B061